MPSALARQWWTAQRFGLTPRKLAGRVARAGVLPRVLVVSLPKAGTHLVERAVCLHPRLYRRFLPTLNPENVGRRGLAGVVRAQRPGQVVVAHLPFDPAYPALLADVKTLFVIRDPRDMAVSLAHYIESRGDHPLHFAYSERPGRALADRARDPRRRGGAPAGAVAREPAGRVRRLARQRRARRALRGADRRARRR